MPRRRKFHGWSKKRGGQKPKNTGDATNVSISEHVAADSSGSSSRASSVSRISDSEQDVGPISTSVECSRSSRSTTAVDVDSVDFKPPNNPVPAANNGSDLDSAGRGVNPVSNNNTCNASSVVNQNTDPIPPNSRSVLEKGKSKMAVVFMTKPAEDPHKDPVAGPSKWIPPPRVSGEKRPRYILSDDEDDEDEAARQEVIRQLANVYNRPRFAPVEEQDVEMLPADEEAAEVNEQVAPQSAVFRSPDEDDLAALLEDIENDLHMIDGHDLEYVEQNVVVSPHRQLQQQAVVPNLCDGRVAEIERERMIRQRPLYMAATNRGAAPHYVGRMNRRCRHCGAKYFYCEEIRGEYSKCCRKGRIQVEPLGEYPELLTALLCRDHPLSPHFLQHILIYNNSFQFASMNANLRRFQGQGPYVYAIQGRLVHHLAHNVNPNEPDRSRFGCIYFLDPDFAAERRMNYSGRDRVNEFLIRAIGDLLQQVNPYAQQYRHLHEVFEEQQARMAANNEVVPEVYVDLVAQRRDRGNRAFDAPQVAEIAGVFEMNEARIPRATLRVFVRGPHLQLREISYCCGLSDPLSFPLLFPNGEPGFDAPQQGDPWLSINKYYAYRIAYRDGFHVLQRAGKLAQQYIVAAYIRVEASRLDFLRNHQNRLRVEEYVGLQDYIANRAEAAGVPAGQRVILPSTYLGSPRSQYQRFQDALAVVERLGPPDLFITMTCNPKWPEIMENIPDGDYSNNHPSLINRVFMAKVKEFIHEDILKQEIFGVAIAVLYVIEFQKRGLPHCHILVTLRDQDKPRTHPARIDEIICAEIPDKNAEPQLYEAVGKFMVHGPCGAQNPNSVCMMENGKCGARFPERYVNETIIRNGYPKYRRRNNGRKIEVVRNRTTHQVGNEFIVPHNPYILLKYQTHINVEACTSIRCVKYLYKYFFKDADQALVQIVERAEGDGGQLEYDEIRSFVNSRYMTPPEAAWRLQEFNMHYSTHTVVRLPVHLPDRQQTYFRPGNEEVALINNQRTMLTEWFELNQRDANARRYLYPEIPEHYVWHQRDKQWNPRRVNRNVVGRMFAVSVTYGDLYYLRLLLLHVRGAESFESLRTLDGRVYPTFREACQARRLLADDQEWFRAMEEASRREMPSQLRRMFAYILVFCDVERPVDLWNANRAFMTEDYTRRRRMTPQEADLRCFQVIQQILNANGRRLTEFGFADVPQLRPENDLPAEQEPARLAEEGGEMLRQLNQDQLAVFNTVMDAVENADRPQRLFFMTGKAGTGKTFLYNTLITVLLGREVGVAPVAWTGMAASHLRGGRTAHSRFGMPINLMENARSRLRAGSREGRSLIECKLLIWDEISMSTRLAFDLVDRTLRDLTQIDRPFGGKVVLVGGDFRQCLPVVIDGDRTVTVEACVKSSQLWPLFQVLELRTNMRLEPNQQQFQEFLDQLGNGTLPYQVLNRNHVIRMPQECVVPSVDQLISSIFGEDFGRRDVVQTLDSAIIAPTNESCNEINTLMLDRLPGDEKVYLSADTAVTDDVDMIARYPLEFLHSLNPSGYPSHTLKLKVGAAIMLLRNLDISKGLCNGSRLLIRRLGDNYLDSELIDYRGQLTGRRVFIPRIDILTPTSMLPFNLKRRQFPVRLAYAITCNKVQGCTLNSVGIYLPFPVFGHGQLYVAFSRARSFDRVKILVCNQINQGQLFNQDGHVYTINIVYPEVL